MNDIDYVPSKEVVSTKNTLLRRTKKQFGWKQIEHTAGVFAIRNKVTKKFYERSLPRTDLHYYCEKLQYCATFGSREHAEKRAREIRGPRWMKDFEVIPVKVTREDNLYGKRSYVEHSEADQQVA